MPVTGGAVLLWGGSKTPSIDASAKERGGRNPQEDRSRGKVFERVHSKY